MTDVDVLSKNDWPSLLEQPNITKPVNEIESSDLLGKWLDSLYKWEVFYKIYAKWIDFSIRMDDIKQRGELITMRRWIVPNKDFEKMNLSTSPIVKKGRSLSRGQVLKQP